LHNNHHAFPTSAKFSVRTWEFDIGWLYICLMRPLGLVKINRLAPQPLIRAVKGAHLGLDNLQAIIINRMHVLRDYTRQVTVPVFDREKTIAAGTSAIRRTRRLLVRQPRLLDEAATTRLTELLEQHAALATVHQFRERLQALWSGTHHVSNENLLEQLQQWCLEAEASGIKALEEFSARLRAYQMARLET